VKILLIVPLYPRPPQVSERTIASLEAQDWNDGQVTVLPMPSQTGLSHYDDLTWKHNKARQMVLADGYDALWSVEADMVVPPDALTKMLSVDADVVYGLYCSRRVGMWLCFPTIDGMHGTSIVADKIAARRAWGNVVTSEGSGFGCTLIRRNVLEALEFRRDTNSAFADDWFFSLDVKARGFRQAHHCGVICGHIVDEHRTYWPDIDADDLCRVEKTDGEGETMETARSEGTYLVLKALDNGQGNIVYPGAIIKLPQSIANILLARRGIELLPDATVDDVVEEVSVVEKDEEESEPAEAAERTTRKSRRTKTIEPAQAEEA